MHTEAERAPCRRYQGGRTFNDFLKFLEDQLDADKGFARSPALDELATSWLGAAPGDAQESLIAKVRAQRRSNWHVACNGVRLGCTVLSGAASRRHGTSQSPSCGFSAPLMHRARLSVQAVCGLRQQAYVLGAESMVHMQPCPAVCCRSVLMRRSTL